MLHPIHHGVSSTSSIAVSKRHGHRRKAATPLRAPEAASPEWYNEVQLPLLVARLLNTSHSHSHPQHLHHRRSSSPSSTSSTSTAPPPLHSAAAALPRPEAAAAADDGADEHLACSRCASEKTPMWRRMGGVLLCNACGLRARRAAATRTRDELVRAGKGGVVAAAEAAVAAANGEGGGAVVVARCSRLAKATHDHSVVAAPAAAAPPAAPASAASDATAVGEATATETDTETETEDENARRSSSVVVDGMEPEQQPREQRQQPCLAFAAVGA